MIPTVIIRHPKERLSKCSLEPLRGQPHLAFLKAKPGFRFDASGFILLSVDAPVLSPQDTALDSPAEGRSLADRLTSLGLIPPGTIPSHRPLLLLDSTWLLLPKLERMLDGSPLPRSLPSGIRTAYPRISKLAEDPGAGLASVEALYLAQHALGHHEPGLLAHYRWRDSFLQQFATDPAVSFTA